MSAKPKKPVRRPRSSPTAEEPTRELPTHPARPSSRAARLLVVLAGIVLGQCVLYGPSLMGSRILLPLDILTKPGFYLPRPPGTPAIPLHDPFLSDLVLATEPGRIYMHRELAAGHFPLWNSHQYAGMPNSLAKLSPFVMLGACFESPKVLAWVELLAACIAGLGMYLFSRRVLVVSFWPAAIAAWGYPLTGFFVLWLGFGTAYPVVWLPWLLTAIHAALGGSGELRREGTAIAAVAVATGLVLVSGRLDVAAQVLLLSGLFAVGAFALLHRGRMLGRKALAGAAVVLFGWGLGIFLAAPDTLHLIEYARSGARAERRSAGLEERPPVGLPALPQVVLPHIHGSTQRGSAPDFPKGQGNLLESSAAAFSGILATLLLAPLAFCSRPHRAIALLLAVLAFVSLAWCLDVPGLVAVLRLPLLSMMSHNRLTFGAAFAIVALAAIGLESLRQGRFARGTWSWIPAAVLAGISIWCFTRGAIGAEPIVARLQAAISQGQHLQGFDTPSRLSEVQEWFSRRHLFSGAIAALGAIAWLGLRFRRHGGALPPWLLPAAGALFVMELLWFGQGQPAQSVPSLYYPPLPVLETIAQGPPGRMIARGCLPAALAQTRGLRDVRGYDAIDPSRFVELMQLAADPRSPRKPYAAIQDFVPRIEISQPDGIEISPILDMLNVRSVVLLGEPPPAMRPPFSGGGYWVLENRRALGRVFVPRQVESVPDDRERLRKLALRDFDPREIAYVESPLGLPSECRGRARIVDESSAQVTVSVEMETGGLVVLADLWDEGWEARLDGQPVPIERTNHALRGVVVPEGASIVEFGYRPASFFLGLRLAGFAILLLVAWIGFGARLRRAGGAGSA